MRYLGKKQEILRVSMAGVYHVSWKGGMRKSKGPGDSHGEDTGAWGMTSKQSR